MGTDQANEAVETVQTTPWRWLVLMMIILVCTGCGGAGSGGATAVSSSDVPALSSGERAENASFVTRPIQFTASDGAVLQAYLTSATPDFRARPTIIEFTPYGQKSFKASLGTLFGPAYNYLLVNVRGSGASSGSFGAFGPRGQKDVAEFLAWACEQPWSNRHFGLYGFSASAIAVYNAMHLPLACVDAAALMAGTADLYRDLIYPGGLLNLAPTVVVGAGVGVPQIAQAVMTLLGGQLPLDKLQSGVGILGLFGEILAHSTEDAFWRHRRLRPGPNHFPVLADTSFYDVESRGPFQAFQKFDAWGRTVHLLALGAHDGFPAGTPGPFPQYERWFDHYLRGIDNDIANEPRVQLLVGNGSFQALSSGDFVRVEASDWPVPGTRWVPLYLSSQRAASGASSLNDGSLALSSQAQSAVQFYPVIPSLPTATDPHTTSVFGHSGAPEQLFDTLPVLVQTNLAELAALTFTTAPFSEPVMVVGPASLDVFVTTTVPGSALYAVVSDVWPDGSAHPVGVGRLSTDFPDIRRERSLVTADGKVVQPYGNYSHRDPATPAVVREYHVEFWPIGNRFAAGHRLRLTLVGASAFLLSVVDDNFVSMGGDTPSRLLLPVLPESDLRAALAPLP